MPLAALLVTLGLQILEGLIPVLGEAIVAGIAAMVARFKDDNPDHPDPIKGVLVDAAALATDVVQRMETIDWGAFFTEDQLDDVKAKAALNDLLGQAAAHGMTLATNTAQTLIRHEVERLRARLIETPAPAEGGPSA